MSDDFIINRLEQLKALADPLRQRILGEVCCTPATTRQIAKRLGTKPTRLYYHMDLLEEVGLIEVVETRPKRGTVERYYQATASQFVVDHSLLRVDELDAAPESEMQTLLVNALATTTAEARTQFDHAQQSAAPQTTVLGRAQVQLTTEQARELAGKIQDWIAECCGTGCNACGPADAATYTLSVAFFPVQPRQVDDPEDD